MLCVETYLAPSLIHGTGLFSAAFIANGTIVWCFREGFDRKIPPTDWHALNQEAQRFLQHFGWQDRDSDCWYLSVDNERFLNHSPMPNTACQDYNGDITLTALCAVRDIEAGEELTEDYSRFLRPEQLAIEGLLDRDINA